ncbi:DUF6531 domain-containing protein [Rubrivivax sp. JA1024]|nr:DUF6531 domain-containing protein [Rubrivivax sp. JA1024]
MSSPMEACQIQHQIYNPTANFHGYAETKYWWSKHCDWDWYFSAAPAPVSYECETGFKRSLPGVCVREEDYQPTPDRDACGGYNNGGNVSASTDYPIDITSGNKTFKVIDFETADRSLSLTRLYNSRPHMGAINGTISANPLGLGFNWRFAFQHELHLNVDYTDNVEIETAGGGSYPFLRKSATGAFEAQHWGYGTYSQTDYSLEFVGTWPSSWSSVISASTQWRVKDRDDNVWVFQTFLQPGSNKYVIGRPISVTKRGGHVTTFAYGTYGELVSVTDPYGKVLSFAWNYKPASAPGGVAPIAINRVTLPDGTHLDYTYDSISTSGEFSNRLVKAEHQSAANVVLDASTYLYENADYPFAVTGIQDVGGTRRWTVEYDASGRATTSTGPDETDKTTLAYGSAVAPSMSRTVTNALGKSATYNYHFGAWTVYQTGVNGNASANCPASARSFTYNSSRYFIATSTDEEGRVTSYTRDAKGRPTAIVEGYGTPSAKTTGITWHTTLNVPAQIVQSGLTTDYSWNTSGQLTQITEADATSQTVPYSTNGQTRVTTFTYDPHGALLTVDGPLAGTGDTTTYTYSTSGYLATVTNEVGHVTTVSSVDGRGLPTTVVDPNNVQTGLTYDSEGRLKAMTVDVGGLAAVTAIDYNVVGDITKITRPNGAFLQYTYDSGRRVIKVEDSNGSYAEYDRDKLGNVTARRIKDSGGTLQFSQTAVFDELGRLLRFIGASNQTWTHGYDKTGNRVSVTDPRSNIFGWSYDSVNRLISTSDEDSNVVTLTRNGKDEITNFRDPRSLNTTFVRSGFGDVIQRVSPDSGTTVYVYNALGKPTQITDGRGVVANLTYDDAGRLLTKQYPAATGENVTYTWDATASGNKGKGRVTAIQDASGSIAWIYNALGQVTQERKTTGTVVYTVGYTYDLDGNVTEITYPSGRTVSYSRDATGLVTGVTTKASPSSSLVTLASNVAYQPFGPLQSLTYGNGLVLWKTFTKDYNPNTLIVEQGSNSVVNRSYTYWNGDFSITNIWDSKDTVRTENYVYTPNQRLQNTYADWGELTYWQDGVGNRTADIFNDGSTTTTKSLQYPYNNNRIAGVAQGSTTLRTITHDGAGNIVTDVRGATSYTYRYNNRGRLDRLMVGTTVKADYAYDGLERMAVRTTQNMTPSATTHYVYDRAGRLLAEASGTGTTQREYVWIDDLPLALFADLDTGTPKQWFAHPDHLNRPTKMTDASQAVVWDAYYWPYGEIRAITGSASNNLRFPGQYYLVESGLHYNWHRHYDPTLGRYTQPDPLGFVDGASIYAYAKSSPTIETDPTGLQGRGIVWPKPPTLVPPFPAPKTPGAWKLMWKLGQLCLRIASGQGGNDDDPKGCYARWEQESDACRARYQETTHFDFIGGCLERASSRRTFCIKNGGPSPLEPPVWGVEDEEIWRNMGR